VWSDDKEPIRVLAVDERVSDLFGIGNVNVNIIPDPSFKHFEFGTRNIHPPRVT